MNCIINRFTEFFILHILTAYYLNGTVHTEIVYILLTLLFKNQLP